MILKILISFLIPIVLFFTAIALRIGFEGGFKNDKLNDLCFYVVIGGAGAILLFFSACIVYGALFGQ